MTGKRGIWDFTSTYYIYAWHLAYILLRIYSIKHIVLGPECSSLTATYPPRPGLEPCYHRTKHDPQTTTKGLCSHRREYRL